MLGKVRSWAVRLKREVIKRVAPYRIVRDLEARQFGWFKHETHELLPGFPITQNDTFVDVGCGDGMSSEFAALCGAEVFAFDIDPDAIASVERRMKGKNPARPFRAAVSDSNPLPLSDGTATRVVCQEVIEHVDDPRQFLAELVRIGKPGARYLLTVPDPASEALQKSLAPDIYWRKPNHLRVLGREEFDGLVEGAGLTIEARTHYSFFWTMWWALFWADKGGFEFGSAGTPVLGHWNKCWTALMAAPNGARVKKALDDHMPKSQIVLARKAA